MKTYVEGLLAYGVQTGLVDPLDLTYTRNRLLEALEHAGVYKCTEEGRAAFLRFTEGV